MSFIYLECVFAFQYVLIQEVNIFIESRGL